MLKLNINNVGASEQRRETITTTSTHPVAAGVTRRRFQSVRTAASLLPLLGERAGVRADSLLSRTAIQSVGRAYARAVAALLLLTALAASAADAPAVSVTDAVSPLQPLLDGLLGKYGWLTTVILVIGSLRILFKPVMLAIENYVKQTPSATDDDRLAKFEAGPIYKIIAFLLDLGASIKLPLINPPTNKDQ